MMIRVPARPVFLALSLVALANAGEASAQSTQLSRLHDALHLNSEQEPSWRRYTLSIRPDPQSEARHRSAQQLLATLPTPRRVELINAEVDEDAAAVHRQGVAVKAFYAGLSPDQQRTFDRQTAQMMQQQSNQTEDEGASPGLRQPSGGVLAPPRQP